jgi:hypothetical protein
MYCWEDGVTRVISFAVAVKMKPRHVVISTDSEFFPPLRSFLKRNHVIFAQGPSVRQENYLPSSVYKYLVAHYQLSAIPLYNHAPVL